LKSKYESKGLVLIGVPADSEVSKLREAITRLAISWDQAFDPQGDSGALWKLFNMDDLPNFVVVDREGKLAAKGIQADKLAPLLEKLIGM
jgi:hypothetical protein